MEGKRMNGTLRQILLMTDGHSNYGEDPVAIARLAQEYDVTVNVIGITDENRENEKGLQEVEAIALAGGGVSEIVFARQLAKTVQMVTRKAMTQTLHGVVNQELKQILGQNDEMEDLPPGKRGQVMEVVDDLGEKVLLEVLVLIDTSASMANKLPMVQEALLDLSISLNSRSGDTKFSLYSFPGKRKPIERLLDWTPKLQSLTATFTKLSTAGMTPTGPALQAALQVFEERRGKRRLEDDENEQRQGRFGF
ncbi:VWA domain-containing protein [Shouchella tritolerans]|uniref:VWA domain-containing protein n=1 Tax=Shouchella tritolerans TaxID=2979466 RepID=UPI002980B78F|nr:VWA domain-containing protein [Shouchella tritolerans]